MAMIHGLLSNHSVVIGVALHCEITACANVEAWSIKVSMGRLFEGEACAPAS
jgi:hypothetical protein